jgi:hypothetical protein
MGPPAFVPLLDGEGLASTLRIPPRSQGGRPTIPWPAGPVQPGGRRTGGGSGTVKATLTPLLTTSSPVSGASCRSPRTARAGRARSHGPR